MKTTEAATSMARPTILSNCSRGIMLVKLKKSEGLLRCPQAEPRKGDKPVDQGFGVDITGKY